MSGRKRSNKILMWIVLGVMVVAMAGFGLNSTLSNSQGSTVLKVGQSEVDAETYSNALGTALNGFAAEQGQQLSMDEARLVGIPQTIKSRLINQATLDEIARRNNIHASDEAVARELLTITAFHDSQGRLNRQSFDIFLETRRMTEDQFLDSLREQLDRSAILSILEGQTLPLENLKAELYEAVGEKRRLQYIEINASNLSDVEEPNEEDIRAQYDSEPEQFLGDPRRDYSIAFILPNPEAISASEIEQYYNTHSEEFGDEAHISYRNLSFPKEEEARAFYENPDFEATAQERGLDEADYMTNDQAISILPEALATAVADAEEDKKAGLFGPIESLLGWSVYDVFDYSPAQTQPLDEVQTQIQNQLASEKVNALLTPEFEAISNAVASGSSPEELANQSPLEFVNWSNEDDPIESLTTSNEFISAIRTAQLGETGDLVKLSNGGIFVMGLEKETEAEIRPYEDVRESIRSALLFEKTSLAMDDYAEELKTEAQSKGLESVASNQGFQFEAVDAMNSEQSYEQLPFALAFELFQKEPDEIWVGYGEETARYIAQVDEVIEFDATSAEGTALKTRLSEQIDTSLADGMIIDYLNAAATEFGAVEYPALIEQVEAQFP